ncbi:MAG: DedA family protein [Bacteroidales bacterium]|jgi:membrane protein DedA with SNARE-associated domain|nr:DedA family protein [Bacteroidales bacterium]
MEIIQTVVDWYMANLNYLTVALLMVIESSFIPFPSEVVIPFAAYKAAEGGLNVFLVVLAGTIGALIGALVNYYLAKYLGRPLVYKLAGSKAGRILLLSEEKIIHAEEYFVKYGNTSTFIGRLVPAVRQLISIPAGLARMNMRNFIIFTTAGAGLWNIILAVVGYFAYEYKDGILPYLDDALIALGAAFLIILIVKSVRKRRKGKPSGSEPGNELKG